MNWSDNLTFIDPDVLGRTSFSVEEVLRDWCTQIDGKIVLCVMFILTFYIVSRGIAPFCLRGFPLYVKTMFQPFVDKFVSLNETLALGGSVVLVIFAHLQYGLSTGYWVWIGLLFMAVLGANYIRFVDWYRGRRGKGGDIRD